MKCLFLNGYVIVKNWFQIVRFIGWLFYERIDRRDLFSLLNGGDCLAFEASVDGFITG